MICREVAPLQASNFYVFPAVGFGARSSVAPKKVMRRVKWSKDRFEPRVVRGGDDLSRVEAEPLPPARLEPIWAFGADQR